MARDGNDYGFRGLKDAQLDALEKIGQQLAERRQNAIKPRGSGGWVTCAGRSNQIKGKPCAVCGHMTHERVG